MAGGPAHACLFVAPALVGHPRHRRPDNLIQNFPLRVLDRTAARGGSPARSSTPRELGHAAARRDSNAGALYPADGALRRRAGRRGLGHQPASRSTSARRLGMFALLRWHALCGRCRRSRAAMSFSYFGRDDRTVRPPGCGRRGSRFSPGPLLLWCALAAALARGTDGDVAPARTRRAALASGDSPLLWGLAVLDRRTARASPRSSC